MRNLNILTALTLIGASTALPQYASISALFPVRYMETCGDGAGVCMTGIECGLQRGRSLGSCSLGTCCRLEKSCGERILANNSFFVSPDFVRPGSSCNVEVEKKWHINGVCQMRLDFIEFDTVGPNFASGACIHDSFTVSGASESVPVICGRNSKQHMYIDVRNSRSINLFVNLGQNSTSRQWRIRVTQIPCYSERLAPLNCLQYYEEDSGTIASFNYGNPYNDTSYPLNLRYQMCFRHSCKLQLSQMGYFGLSRRAANEQFANNVGDLEVDESCVNIKNTNLNENQRAYLLIDGFRICGNKFLRGYETRNEISSIAFNSPVVEQDRNNVNNGPFPGFQLQYKQLCGRFSK